MKSKTATVHLEADQHRAFAYLSDLNHLPEWATEFCRELKCDNGKFRVVTCDPDNPELLFRIESDERTGVIDMFAGPSEDQMTVFPTRVVGLPGGSCIFLFTMFQFPGMNDEKFEAQYRSLLREMQNIKAQLS